MFGCTAQRNKILFTLQLQVSMAKWKPRTSKCQLLIFRPPQNFQRYSLYIATMILELNRIWAIQKPHTQHKNVNHWEVNFEIISKYCMFLDLICAIISICARNVCQQKCPEISIDPLAVDLFQNATSSVFAPINNARRALQWTFHELQEPHDLPSNSMGSVLRFLLQRSVRIPNMHWLHRKATATEKNDVRVREKLLKNLEFRQE